ncbi:MAG: universal stress protein [Nitrospirota bacterium]
MRKILLILSTTRKSSKSVDLAINLAKKEGAEIIVLFVIDKEIPANVISKLSEEGWIGSNPSDRLYNAIEREYAMHGKINVERIEVPLREAGIRYHSLIIKGDFVAEVLNVMEEEEVDLAIITRRKRSGLSRFIFGSAVLEIIKKSKCKVRIVDE